MSERQISLVLLAKAVGVEYQPRGFDDRKTLQKVVYLASVLGADLGYQFGWYVYGPYSPALTRDYYDLRNRGNVLQAAESEELRSSAVSALRKVKRLKAWRHDTGLSDADWLELLASYTYLHKASPGTSDKDLAQEKPRLATYLPIAKDALSAVGIVQ